MRAAPLAVPLIVVLACACLPARAENMSDYDAIKTTIFDYFDGVKLADRERLERAFAVETAHMKGYLKNKAGEYELSSRPMREVIDDWAAREPSPDMQGRMLALDVYDDVAAQVLFDFNGIYIDAFQLAKVDGQWRIVNKFYIGR